MSKPFKAFLVTKGILIAVVISFILTLLLSLIYYFTSVQESSIHSMTIIGISIIAASFYTSLKSGSKGLIYGLFIGLGFFLLSLIVYYIFYESNPSWIILLEKNIISLSSGALGGTIGAVLKK